MIKRLIFFLLLICLSPYLSAQKYITKTGFIGFYSHTPIEDIKGDNNQVASILDISTGDLVFMVLIKSFRFEKALMQEHFNENYLDSDKFPRATFAGKIKDYPAIDPSKDSKHEVTVEGDLNLHDVTKKITTNGIIEISGGKISASSKFILVPEDFNIKIPNVVRDNIAKTVEVTVNMKYDPPQTK
jgi:hypothetical protein